MHPATPFQLLTPGGAPGVLRRRVLSGLPSSNRVWRVGAPTAVPPGEASHDSVLFCLMREVDAFHGRTAWTRVQIGSNDCNAYARQLICHLTGVADALAMDPRRQAGTLNAAE
jgi:hypothetical protein